MQRAVCVYMQCLLQYELLGRKGAEESWWEFGWGSVQAYGAKFPFSDGVGLLKRLACASGACTSTLSVQASHNVQTWISCFLFGPSPLGEGCWWDGPVQFYRLLAKGFGHSL